MAQRSHNSVIATYILCKYPEDQVIGGYSKGNLGTILQDRLPLPEEQQIAWLETRTALQKFQLQPVSASAHRTYQITFP